MLSAKTVAIALANRDGLLTAWNRAFQAWIDSRSTPPRSHPFLALADIVGDREAAAILTAAADTQTEWLIPTALPRLRSAGALVEGLASVRKLEGLDGHCFVVELQARSSADAGRGLRRDAVTQLVDRESLGDAYNAWQGESSDQLRAALLFVDLDGFKQVNDNYGHQTGDDVLRVLAKRWLGCVRSGDLIGRWGGDEFVVLLRGAGTIEQAQPLIDRLRAATTEPIDVGQNALRLDASIGAAATLSGKESLADLVNEADRRMYEAKRMSRESRKADF